MTWSSSPEWQIFRRDAADLSGIHSKCAALWRITYEIEKEDKENMRARVLCGDESLDIPRGA